jgi:hypothetical protein
LKGTENQKISSKVQDALNQLEANLKGEIQGADSLTGMAQNDGLKKYVLFFAPQGVDNVEDEIAYWKTIPKSQNILQILVQFQKEYR